MVFPHPCTAAASLWPAQIAARRGKVLIVCALLAGLAACTMPKKAPTEENLPGQPGGTEPVPQLSPAPSRAEAPDPHPPMAARPDLQAWPKAVTQPRVLQRVTPEYPPALIADGLMLEGQVLVRFTVDVSGQVRDPKVRRSTHPQFEKAAMAALRHWRFEPARDAAGQPAPAIAQQAFQFRVQD